MNNLKEYNDLKHKFTISQNGYIIKSLEIEDIESLRVLRNKYENRKCFLYNQIITEEEQINWFNNYLKKKDDYMFAIFKEDNQDIFLGAVAIYNFDFNSKKAEFGRIVLDKDIISEKGVGAIITKAICDFAFKNFNISEVYLEVFEENIAAVRTYEKVGFRKISVNMHGNKTLLKMSLANKNSI